MARRAKSGDNSGVEIAVRIENLLAEKANAMAEFRESIADLYMEAKAAGCDPKAMRQAIAERARQRKRDEQDANHLAAVDAYREALRKAMNEDEV